MRLPFMLKQQDGWAALIVLMVACTPKARGLEPAAHSSPQVASATIATGPSSVDAGIAAARPPDEQSQANKPGKKVKPGKPCPPNAKGKAARRCIPPAEQNEPTAF